MKYELFVAVRLLREGRAQTVLIFIGVAFGVAVMIFVGALMSGLQASLVAQTLSVQPHISIVAADENARDVATANTATILSRMQKSHQRTKSMDNWRTAQQIIQAIRGVKGVATVTQGAALAIRAGVSRSVTLMGVVPQSFQQIIDVQSKLVSGNFRLGPSETTIGVELARALNVKPGDKITVSLPRGAIATLTVNGIFDMGSQSVNQRWVLVPMRQAQSLLGFDGRVTDIQVRVQEPFEAERIARKVTARTGLQADSWMKLNDQLLKALRSQSASGYVIRFFVIVAVALGIASVLAVSVVNKAREIGIMRATGTSRNAIMRIFLIQGAMVGMIGSLLGSAIGALFSVLYAGLATNTDGTPTFSVELGLPRFVQSFVIATVLGLVSAMLPARRAARLDPAEVISRG